MRKCNNLDLGIAILFFEKVDQTIECIQSVLPSKMPIYVLNNNSSDESTRKLKDFCEDYSNITIFESQKNLGPAGGRNFLVSHTTEKWLLFLDSDITVKTKNWLALLVKQIKKHSDIEAFVFRVYNLHEKVFSSIRSIEVHEEVISKKHSFFSKSVNVFRGGASCINRGLFQRLGLYDEKMAAFEEREMSLRAIASGYPIKGRKINSIILVHDHRVAKKEEDKLAANIRYDRDKLQSSIEYMAAKYKYKLSESWYDWSGSQKKLIVDGEKGKSPDSLVVHNIKSFLLKFRLIRTINDYIKKLKK